MNRRHFLAGSASAVALAAAAPLPAQDAVGKGRFKLKYAPHFGMFRRHAGDAWVDQLRFMADEGFLALEDNRMKDKPVELQEKIAAEMERLGMEMGVFVAHADFTEPTFASSKPEAVERIVNDMKDAVELAKRVRAKWCTVVPGGYDQRIEWDYQTSTVIDNLKRAAEILEPAGLTAVLEPLNPWTDHPGCFLSKIPQAYLICRAVGSPSIKILDDLYHQQITEGNLIPNMDRAWDEIAYFQIGDNPGRREPTTGEINYKNVFRHIHAKGFTGIMGMEHGMAGSGKEGERALIDAYVAVDDF